MNIISPEEYGSFLLPPHLRDGMERWIEQGITPGSSLGSLLRWLIAYAPEGSYGSDKVFSQWPLYLAALKRQEASHGEA